MKRPTIKSPCVADRAAMSGERIAEFSLGECGGLISLRSMPGGSARLEIYCVDGPLEIVTPKARQAPDWASYPAMMLRTLARAESFISGFEDDEEQEGIPALLADLRAVTAGQSVPSESPALAVLRRILPYAESRAEDSQEDAEGYAAGSDLRAEADGYAAKATAAVDDAKALLAGAPVAPDVNADMLAALRLALPVCEDAYHDAKLFELNGRTPEAIQSTDGALAAWNAVKAVIASAEGQASQDGGEEDAGDMGERDTLNAVRDLIESVEGGFISAEVISKAREAYASLCVIMADAGDEPEEPSQDEPGEAEPATPRMPLTSDIGFLIRDMIEGRDFVMLDPNHELRQVGEDRVGPVDCSDADNLRIMTDSGALFVVRIIREG